MTVRPGPDALRALADTWLTGFGVSRQVPVRRDGAVTEVEVGSKERRLELVLIEPDEALMRSTLARLIGTADVWSTVLTTEPRRWNLPTGAKEVLTDEVLMVVDLAVAAEPGPTDRRLEFTVDGDRAFVHVLDGEVVAAQGQVALVDGDAIFDRIATEDDYRRQGLGTAVMGALTGWAVARDARRGILAASPDGQALYRKLGWEPVGAMLTVAGIAPTD